ncbi:class II aldolase/adducin family protein [Enterococcus sp. AZ072]|uniref:class II aldolase/adducin family protein n=1 Tax=unclassified Enterococcus TaxID=2608891 RepID=UPI003D2D590F
MLYLEERTKLCKFVKTMYDRKFTNSAGGNVSVKINDEHFIMTPTLMSQNHLCNLTPEQILVIDKNERIVEGSGKITREINMHMACYEENLNIGCVVHAHALDSMVFACMGLDMPNISEATQKLEDIRCLEFAPATSPELARVVRKEVKQDQTIPKAYLLRKHGVLVVGATLEKTYDMLERLEWNAYIAKEYLIFKQVGVSNIDDLVSYNYNIEE